MSRNFKKNKWSAALFVLAGGGAVASTALATAEPSAAETLFAQLKKANELRSSNATEAEQFEETQRESRLQLATLHQQIDHNQQTLQTLTLDIQKKEAELARIGQSTMQTQHMQDAANRFAQLIAAYLAKLNTTPVLGLKTADINVASADAQSSLKLALEHLEAVEERLKNVSTAIVVGVQADGTQRTVELLRIGGALAYWQSLDGVEAGPAVQHSNKLEIVTARNKDETVAIRQAFALSKKTDAMTQLLLPLHSESRKTTRMTTSDEK